MNIVKRLLNIGLCASIQNLSINNKQIGGFNKVVVLCKTEESQKKVYITASSIYGDHVFQDGVFLWRSWKYKTKEEAIGNLTKEVRLAQIRYPEIHFFKTDKIVGGEILEFDEFFDGEWIRSKYDWSWDPVLTMRDNL
jgi:hypothetical protein